MATAFVAIGFAVALGGTMGFDVARRARTTNPEVAVIYLGGEVALDSLCGVEGTVFLSKPVTEPQPFAVIRNLLDRRHAPLIAQSRMI